VIPASESYDCVTIFAPLLEPANRAMAVMAAGATGGRAWPADVRLAAPPNPVVAVPSELPELDRDWHAAFDAAVDVLVEAGARIVTVDMEPFLAAAKLGRFLAGLPACRRRYTSARSNSTTAHGEPRSVAKRRPPSQRARFSPTPSVGLCHGFSPPACNNPTLDRGRRRRAIGYPAWPAR